MAASSYTGRDGYPERRPEDLSKNVRFRRPERSPDTGGLNGLSIASCCCPGRCAGLVGRLSGQDADDTPPDTCRTAAAHDISGSRRAFPDLRRFFIVDVPD